MSGAGPERKAGWEYKAYWKETQEKYWALPAPRILPSGRKNDWLVRVYIVTKDSWLEYAKEHPFPPPKGIDGYVHVLQMALVDLDTGHVTSDFTGHGYHLPLFQPIVNLPDMTSGKLFRLNTAKTGDTYAANLARLRVVIQRVFTGGICELEGSPCLASHQFLEVLPKMGAFRPYNMAFNCDFLAWQLSHIGHKIKVVSGHLERGLPFLCVPAVQPTETFEEDMPKWMMVVCEHCATVGVDGPGLADFIAMQRCDKCLTTW